MSFSIDILRIYSNDYSKMFRRCKRQRLPNSLCANEKWKGVAMQNLCVTKMAMLSNIAMAWLHCTLRVEVGSPIFTLQDYSIPYR